MLARAPRYARDMVRRRMTSSRSSTAVTGDELAHHVDEARRLVRRSVPDIDEQTLVTILASVLRPFGTGKRFFLRRQPDGGFFL
jgi:hypothetical protein